jgi:hypothetical protein
MTREQWAKLTPEEQRIKVAELAGCTGIVKDTISRTLIAFMPSVKGGRCRLPDYLNDLNAMHEAEKLLTGKQYKVWNETLEEIVSENHRRTGYKIEWELFRQRSATAAQRAEAFVLTMEDRKDEIPTTRK